MKWRASWMTLEMASRSLLRSLGLKTSGEVCHQRRENSRGNQNQDHYSFTITDSVLIIIIAHLNDYQDMIVFICFMCHCVFSVSVCRSRKALKIQFYSLAEGTFKFLTTFCVDINLQVMDNSSKSTVFFCWQNDITITHLQDEDDTDRCTVLQRHPI